VGTAVRGLIILAALALAAAGAIAILSQAASGAQPWDPELSDNFVFFKAIPFVLALGVAFGLARSRGSSGERRDGMVRRFSGGTIVGHWLITVGFVLALPTGLWQYLGGLIDVHLPIPLYLIYRIHYIGAAIILFAVAYFVTYWWATGERSLVVPRGEWRRHLTGFAQELPARVRRMVAARLRLDLSQHPEPGRFTFYETAFSFPTWTFALALITITGFLKAMRYVYPIPGPMLYIASTLHVAAMGLLILKVLDHLRYTLPRWPLMTAMVTGWIRENALRRVLASSASRPNAPAPDAGRERDPVLAARSER
jgi:cytochrome b subunit of formate dehydrogenase